MRYPCHPPPKRPLQYCLQCASAIYCTVFDEFGPDNIHHRPSAHKHGPSGRRVTVLQQALGERQVPTAHADRTRRVTTQDRPSEDRVAADNG
eukprot:5284034-Prymnesium_polylepis.1